MIKASLISLLLLAPWTLVQASNQDVSGLTYQQARWHPLHFKPAIAQATNEECLACHAEVLETRVRPATPAGVNTNETRAWYQTLDTYAGDQETFHRRHLVTDYAKAVMALKCNTCHQGNDPRDETAMSNANGDPTLTQRKHVDPQVCLLCHGQFPNQIMQVPDHWLKVGESFQWNCVLCHQVFRINRHQVNYLKPEAIETLAKERQDVCFGCHGGRPWYRISFPYPRHPYPGMAPQVPDWAKDRPTQSEPRFLTGMTPATPQGQSR